MWQWEWPIGWKCNICSNHLADKLLLKLPQQLFLWRVCWWRVPPERTNTTTVREERTSRREQLRIRNRSSHSKKDSLSLFKSVLSMYRGRVFIGDGSPTTLRYYTVMPPNNYIPGIFPGYNHISTSFDKLHPYLFCLLGPLQPIGPRLAHLHSVNKIPFAAKVIKMIKWRNE